jgi:ribosomal protein S13
MSLEEKINLIYGISIMDGVIDINLYSTHTQYEGMTYREIKKIDEPYGKHILSKEITRRIRKDINRTYEIKEENYKPFKIKKLEEKIRIGKYENSKICDIARIDFQYLKSLKDSHLMKVSNNLWLQLEKLSERKLKKVE